MCNCINNDKFRFMFLSANPLFAGTYTEKGEKGLYLFDLNRGQGTFKLLSEADAGPNPSYFCISKKKGLIYAADEVMEFNGVKGGGVTALRYIPESGVLKKLKIFLYPMAVHALYHYHPEKIIY